MTESGVAKAGMENPFTLKVGQVFTGFGIGCGVGIGVGRPLNLGAIPALDQVMRAASGATVAFSGVGRHTNNLIQKMGLKSIEAGIGCGVGFGHGFGAGLAIKSGAIHNIQACLIQGLTGIMKKLNLIPDLSFPGKLGLPVSVGTGMQVASETAGKALQDPMGTSRQLASQTAEKVYQTPFGKSIEMATQTAKKTLQDPATGAFTSNSSAMSIGTLLQGTAPQLTNKVDSKEEAGRLQTENQILQMLLRHQEMLKELKEENTAFRRILVEELNVSPDKLHKHEIENYSHNAGSNCFECRRRARKRT